MFPQRIGSQLLANSYSLPFRSDSARPMASQVESAIDAEARNALAAIHSLPRFDSLHCQAKGKDQALENVWKNYKPVGHLLALAVTREVVQLFVPEAWQLPKPAWKRGMSSQM